jgi:hypothetical protein
MRQYATIKINGNDIVIITDDGMDWKPFCSCSNQDSAHSIANAMNAQAAVEAFRGELDQ